MELPFTPLLVCAFALSVWLRQRTMPYETKAYAYISGLALAVFYAPIFAYCVHHELVIGWIPVDVLYDTRWWYKFLISWNAPL